MPPRDPRRDPQRGDKAAWGNDKRTVNARLGNTVIVEIGGRFYSRSLKQWRAWAKNAKTKESE